MERYQDIVYGFAFHKVQNFSDAQDLAQEAFLAAYCSLDKLRDQSKFAGLIKGITANLCMLHLRRQRKFLSVDELSPEEQEMAIETDRGSMLSPDQQYEKEMLSETVRNAIRKLPENHQLSKNCFRCHKMSLSFFT